MKSNLFDRQISSKASGTILSNAGQPKKQIVFAKQLVQVSIYLSFPVRSLNSGIIQPVQEPITFTLLALKNASNEDINIIKNGVGGYLNEGYGEVLINPSFLLKEGSFSLNKIVKENRTYEVEEKEVDNTLI